MPDFDTSRGGSPADPNKAKKSDIPATALLRYSRWLEKELPNINKAYEDLNFCWADAQWDAKAEADRTTDGRPCLIVNHLPQFIHQVTGDMRQMKPAIHVVPVDSGGDKDTAKTIGGIIRYIENRSDASAIYTAGADSQVSCGIGAWRVTTEYADATTFNQEIRIEGVSDAVAIACDPDAHLPCREDAKWWIVPVDMSRETFKEKWPDASVEDFDTLPTPNGIGWGSDGAANNYYTGWYSKDMVRVAEYWVKEPMKRTLALMPDGSIVDLTEKDEQEKVALLMQGARVEKRDSHKVRRYLITAAHVLETSDWPGMLIPIIPVIGEEIRIGRGVVRRGLIRGAKDAQRMVNFFFSGYTEAVALQPKAPFLATLKNIEQFQQMWAEANTKNLPYLLWEPDPANGGQLPSRVPPAISAQGMTDGIQLATDQLKSVIGIYDTELGKSARETSGVAIHAREKQGDTGSYLYIDNWTRAIKRTGTIILDLMPHIYDSQRMIRIMGEDGKVDLKEINKPIGMQITMPDGSTKYHDPRTNELVSAQAIENDLTVGSYDVVMETGPSYATKREEARDNMVEFIRSAPDTAPAVMDLVAKAQDWPLADEFANRLEAIAPPAVQKLISKQKQEQGEEEQPDPQAQMQQQLAQRGAEAEVSKAEWEVKKLQVETAKIGSEARPQGEGADPVAMVDAQAKRQKMDLDAEMHSVDIECKRREADSKEKLAAVQLEIALVNLATAKAKGAVDTAGAVQEMQNTGAQMQRDADNHTVQLVSGAKDAEKADESAEREAENADRTAEREDMLAKAKVKQMNKPKVTA